MAAVVQDGYGSADSLHVGEVDTPAVHPLDVLVEVRAASINAADCHFVHGIVPVRLMGGLRRPKAVVRGVDLAGTVVEVGSGVTRFKAGDEVFGCARGTFARYAAGPEDRLALKPAQLTFEQAASLPVAATTALQGLRDKGGVEAGQRVLIYGAGGGVGTFAVQVAKALGAHVTAVTGPRNLDLVGSLGPDELVDYTKERIPGRRQRYDVVLDVAATLPLRECRRLLKGDGTLVIAGAPKGGFAALAVRLASATVRSRLLSQRVTFFLAQVNQKDLESISALVVDGRLKPSIDRTYHGLEQIPEAMRYALTGQARAKVVIAIP